MHKDVDVSMPNDAFEPVRDRVNITIGSLVRRGEDVFRIAQVLDFESLIGVDVLTGRSTSLRLGDLRPLAHERNVPQLANVDMAQIADEDWRIAQERLAAIRPLLDRMHIGRITIEQRGKETGVDPATLYRWLQRYPRCQDSCRVTELKLNPNGGGVK